MKLRLPTGKIHDAEQRHAFYKEIKSLPSADRLLQPLDAAQALADAVGALEPSRALLALELAREFIANGAAAAAIPEAEQVQILEGLTALLSKRTPAPVSKEIALQALGALADQQLGLACLYAPGLLERLCEALGACTQWDPEHQKVANAWGHSSILVKACVVLSQLCNQAPNAMAAHASAWVPQLWHAALAQHVAGSEPEHQLAEVHKVVRAAALNALDHAVRVLAEPCPGLGPQGDAADASRRSITEQLAQGLKDGAPLLTHLQRAIGMVLTINSSTSASEAAGGLESGRALDDHAEQLALDGARAWGQFVDLLGASYYTDLERIQRLFKAIKPGYESTQSDGVSSAAFDAWTCAVRSCARYHPEELLKRSGLLMPPITYVSSRTSGSSTTLHAALRCWSVLCNAVCGVPGAKPGTPLPKWAVSALQGTPGIQCTQLPSAAGIQCSTAMQPTQQQASGLLTAANLFQQQQQQQPSTGAEFTPHQHAKPTTAILPSSAPQGTGLRSPSPPALIPTPHMRMLSPSPSAASTPTGHPPQASYGTAAAAGSGSAVAAAGPSFSGWGAVPELGKAGWRKMIQPVMDFTLVRVSVPLDAAAAAQVVQVLCRLTTPDTAVHVLKYLTKVLSAWRSAASGSAARAGALDDSSIDQPDAQPSARLLQAMADAAHCGAWVELQATLLAALLCKLAPDPVGQAAADPTTQPPSTSKPASGTASSGSAQRLGDPDALEMLTMWECCQQQLMRALHHTLVTHASTYSAAASAAVQAEATCAAAAPQQGHGAGQLPRASPLQNTHGRNSSSGTLVSVEQLQEQAAAAQQARAAARTRTQQVVVVAVRFHSQAASLLSAAAAELPSHYPHLASALPSRLLQLLSTHVHAPILTVLSATNQLHEVVPPELWQHPTGASINTPLSPHPAPHPRQQGAGSSPAMAQEGGPGLKPAVGPHDVSTQAVSPFGLLCASWARALQLMPSWSVAGEWMDGLQVLKGKAGQGLASVAALLHLLDCVGRAVGWVPPSYLETAPRNGPPAKAVGRKQREVRGLSTGAGSSSRASTPQASEPQAGGTPGPERAPAAGLLHAAAAVPGAAFLAVPSGGVPGVPATAAPPQQSEQASGARQGRAFNCRAAAAVYLRTWSSAAAHAQAHVDRVVDETKYNDARQVLLCGLMEMLERLIYTLVVLASDTHAPSLGGGALSAGVGGDGWLAVVEELAEAGMMEAVGLWTVLHRNVSRYILERWKARSNKPVKLVHSLAVAISSEPTCLARHSMAQFCLCWILELLTGSPQMREALSPKYPQGLATAMGNLIGPDGQHPTASVQFLPETSPPPFSPLPCSTPFARGAGMMEGFATPAAGTPLCSSMLSTPMCKGMTHTMTTPGVAAAGTSGPGLPMPAVKPGSRPVAGAKAAGRPKGSSEAAYEVSNTRRAVQAVVSLLRMLPAALLRTQQVLVPASSGNLGAGDAAAAGDRKQALNSPTASQPVSIKREACDSFKQYGPASGLRHCLNATCVFLGYLSCSPPTMATAQALELLALPLTQLLSVSLPALVKAAGAGMVEGAGDHIVTADVAERLMLKINMTWAALLECLTALLKHAAQCTQQSPAPATAAGVQPHETGATRQAVSASVSACITALQEPLAAALKCGWNDITSPTFSALESLVSFAQLHHLEPGAGTVAVGASQGGGWLPDLVLAAADDFTAAGFVAVGSLPCFGSLPTANLEVVEAGDTRVGGEEGIAGDAAVATPTAAVGGAAVGEAPAAAAKAAPALDLPLQVGIPPHATARVGPLGPEGLVCSEVQMLASATAPALAPAPAPAEEAVLAAVAAGADIASRADGDGQAVAGAAGCVQEACPGIQSAGEDAVMEEVAVATRAGKDVTNANAAAVDGGTAEAHAHAFAEAPAAMVGTLNASRTAAAPGASGTAHAESNPGTSSVAAAPTAAPPKLPTTVSWSPLARKAPYPVTGNVVARKTADAVAAALTTATAAASFIAAASPAVAVSPSFTSAMTPATSTATATRAQASKSISKATADGNASAGAKQLQQQQQPPPQPAPQRRTSGRKRRSVGVHTYSRLDASQSQHQPWLGSHSSSSSSSGPVHATGLSSGAALQDDAATAAPMPAECEQPQLSPSKRPRREVQTPAMPPPPAPMTAASIAAAGASGQQDGAPGDDQEGCIPKPGVVTEDHRSGVAHATADLCAPAPDLQQAHKDAGPADMDEDRDILQCSPTQQQEPARQQRREALLKAVHASAGSAPAPMPAPGPQILIPAAGAASGAHIAPNTRTGLSTSHVSRPAVEVPTWQPVLPCPVLPPSAGLPQTAGAAAGCGAVTAHVPVPILEQPAPTNPVMQPFKPPAQSGVPSALKRRHLGAASVLQRTPPPKPKRAHTGSGTSCSLQPTGSSMATPGATANAAGVLAEEAGEGRAAAGESGTERAGLAVTGDDTGGGAVAAASTGSESAGQQGGEPAQLNPLLLRLLVQQVANQEDWSQLSMPELSQAHTSLLLALTRVGQAMAAAATTATPCTGAP